MWEGLSVGKQLQVIYPVKEAERLCNMYKTISTPQRRSLSQEEVVPVCLSCGNRKVFLREAPEGTSTISPSDILNLGGRKGIKCGRCGCRNCIVLDYAD
jgi:hypothetical protein